MEPARVRVWAEALTGEELDEAGAFRPLDAKTWQERRRQAGMPQQ
jgi:hypothetical protein